VTTDCAALTFTEMSLRAKLLNKSSSGVLPRTAPFQISSTNFLPFPAAPASTGPLNADEARLQASVKWDVDWLRNNPLFDQRTQVSGWVYEVETGRLREVDTSTLEAREKELIAKEQRRIATSAAAATTTNDTNKDACGCGGKH
jgi:carbonic anhydrase